MDRWATLVPDRPKRFSGSSSYAPTSLTADAPVPSSLSSNAERDHVGELPVSVVLRVLEHVAVPELASCALAARPLARLVADERLWKAKLDALDWHEVEGLVVSGAPSKPLHDGQQRALHAESSVTAGKGTGAGADDDFGDFEESGPGVHVADESFGDFTTAETPGASGPGRPTGSAGGNLLEFCDEQDRVGELRDFSRISLNKGNSRASVPPGGIVAGKDTRGNARPTSVPLFSYRAEAALPSAPASAKLFRTYSTALAPFISSLRTSAAPTSSLIFSKLPNLSAQATLLGNLARFVSPRVKGVRDWPEVGGKTREAADYLEGVLISAFEGADARRAEAGPGEQPKIARAESDMRAHAYMLHDLASAWTDATNVAPGEAPGGAACAQVFLERRAIFYGGLGHDPLKNVM